jgi:hypothetical protein
MFPLSLSLSQQVFSVIFGCRKAYVACLRPDRSEELQERNRTAFEISVKCNAIHSPNSLPIISSLCSAVVKGIAARSRYESTAGYSLPDAIQQVLHPLTFRTVLGLATLLVKAKRQGTSKSTAKAKRRRQKRNTTKNPQSSNRGSKLGIHAQG